VLAGIEVEKHNHQNETNCQRDDKPVAPSI